MKPSGSLCGFAGRVRFDLSFYQFFCLQDLFERNSGRKPQRRNAAKVPHKKLHENTEVSFLFQPMESQGYWKKPAEKFYDSLWNFRVYSASVLRIFFIRYLCQPL